MKNVQMILIQLIIVCFLGNVIGKQGYNVQDQQGIIIPLQYNLLNKGETIKIPLQSYFPFSSNYSIYEQTSTANIRDLLNITFSLDKIQVEQSELMSAKLNMTNINLSQYRILDIKTIYNQPNKLFLLEKNLIMMYSYRQKSQDKVFLNQQAQLIYNQIYKNRTNNLNDPLKITVVNITAQSGIVGKNQNLSCYQMEALPDQGVYKLVVLCKLQGNAIPQTRNYIVAFNMEQNNRGFVTSLVYNSSNYAENRVEKQLNNLKKRINGRRISNRLKQNKQKSKNKINTTKNIILQNLILNSLLNNQSLQSQLPTFQICQQYHIKYFDSIYIQQKRFFQTVLLFCNGSSDPSTIKQIYTIYFTKSRVALNTTSNPKFLNITNCLLNSKYLTEYQNGFVSVISNFLHKYYQKVNSRGRLQSVCQPFNIISLFGYQFITARNQSGIQTIYIISRDQIIIFQSYSPNYQKFPIECGNLSLKSYAISNQILSLHYQDQSQQKLVILAYNIKAIYPHLVDRVQYNITSNTGIYLFSVMNYLEEGNYFFIYQRQKNTLSLTYYDGQFVKISIKDPLKSIGNLKLAIVNRSSIDQRKSLKINQNKIKDDPQNVSILQINLRIRPFNDSSIVPVDLTQIKVNNKFFNINLEKAVIGPLGRFYKMPNPFSSLQFVNSFHQIDISQILQTFEGKKLLTFSINTFLNDPILTFYFQNYLIMNCDLEFDYILMRPMITRCIKVTDTQNTDMNPQQVIIYEQGRFIQHQGHRIEFCRISSSTETICIEGDFQDEPIKKLKLIKYEQIQDGLQFISIFIIFDHMFKQKDYIKPANATLKTEITKFTNVQITETQIDYLKYMNIRTVEYDEGYQKFLLLYMMEHFDPVTKSQNEYLNDMFPRATDLHIVQIYYKPQIQRNQSSNFIGHLIQQFVSPQLQNVFIIDNKILMLSITAIGSQIQEYVIYDFKCIKSRMYPLYEHSITKNGSHSINSGFLFVQVEQLELEQSKYLVYNPSLNTTNVITHSFEKKVDSNVIFTQKVTQSDNVMAINGHKLITLCLPNMVIKLNQGKKLSSQLHKQIQQQLNKPGKSTSLDTIQPQEQQKVYSFSSQVDISFIDNNDILRILEFKYFYDISDSKIQYNHTIPEEVYFDSTQSTYELQINASLITGPVSQYNIQNVSSHQTQIDDSAEKRNICEFVEFNTSDIFTKTRCIKYFNSKEDGIMQDFLTYQEGLFEDVTIIVTDKKILCVEDMQINTWQQKPKTKQCSIYQQDTRIFIVCLQNNATTMNLLIMEKSCQFTVRELPKPQFLKYNIFKMQVTGGQAIFQVPIRSQENKIYYVSQFFDNNQTANFSEDYVLLKHYSQEEYMTKDFTTNDTYIFLLEKDLLIFNIARRDQAKITPDDWISGDSLRKLFGTDEEFTYINCLQFNQLLQQIILQIGTILRSYQLHLLYANVKGRIQITTQIVYYVYKNPWSCYNTLLSKSRYYKNMTIKMCTFMPESHYVFSNFIPITENKQNSYIIFYEKNFLKNESYPFRMDIIYTNIYSNDNFQLPFQKGNLLIGSLFNLLCEYDLRDSYMFTFTVNKKIQEYIRENDLADDEQSTIKTCHFNLNLSNQNQQQIYPITIKLDFSDNSNQFWTDWKHYIQRIVVLVLIGNYIRLQLKKKAQKNRVINTVKKKRSRSDSFDQQFDVQVRFHSKKSL